MIIKKFPALKLVVLLLAVSIAVFVGACPENSHIFSGIIQENQDSGGQDSENQGSGAQDLENQGSGDQDSENQDSKNQDSENQGSGEQDSENQDSENQDSENQGSGEQDSENQDSEAQEQEEQEPAEQENLKNYISGPDALNWGISANASVLTLGLTPGNDTTEVYVNWYAAERSTTGKVAKVRFVRGTFAAGAELIEVTGAAPTAVGTSGTNTSHKAKVTGLKPGYSYQYAVSSDGTNWSREYDFKIPAASGSFKFAVISDPQLNANVDSVSRYTPSPGTTAQSWKETVEKVVTAGVSFIASCGDQVDTNNNETQYSNFFAPDGLRNLPLAPVIGNHDPNSRFFYHFNIPNEQGTAENTGTGANYYYRYNNILFVALNTSDSPGSTTAAEPYITRFRTTIRNAKAAHAGKYDWLIVQHHKSTASVGSHCADKDLQYYVEAGFEKLMSDENVDFVIAGHDHVYARSYPLQGRDGGKVSLPDTTNKTNTFNNPGNPIYMTFNTASGLKYYMVSADTTTTFSGSVTSNSNYPYLGEIINNGDGATHVGSAAYMDGYLPVSNLVYSQALIPSYTIVNVDGRTITFRTYPIASGSGGSGASYYSFDASTPYDWVTVTK